VTYQAVATHKRTQRSAHQPRKPRKLMVQPRLRTAVFTLLAQSWSPWVARFSLVLTLATLFAAVSLVRT
jgi:IS30 family transposase